MTCLVVLYDPKITRTAETMTEYIMSNLLFENEGVGDGDGDGGEVGVGGPRCGAGVVDVGAGGAGPGAGGTGPGAGVVGVVPFFHAWKSLMMFSPPIDGCVGGTQATSGVAIDRQSMVISMQSIGK